MICWLTLLLPYFLACFIVLFAERLNFCFAKSLIIGFAISEVESKGANVTVGFFEWSL